MSDEKKQTESKPQPKPEPKPVTPKKDVNDAIKSTPPGDLNKSSSKPK
jgi:hypothetical protein